MWAEAAEPIPLEKRWGSHPIPGPRGIHGLQGREEGLLDVLSTVMTTDVDGRREINAWSVLTRLKNFTKKTKTIPEKRFSHS